MQRARPEEQNRAANSASANPYRLDVFTTSVREVVAEAGGWIFDRVLAGWTVTVITDGADDAEHAVRILGGEATVHSATLDPVRPRPYGIAVTTTLFATDSQLQSRIADALDRQTTEISLIGVLPIGKLDPRILPVTHRLSSAAQAFKAYSLSAAGLPSDSVAVTESFCSALLPAPDLVVNEKRRRTERSAGSAQAVAEQRSLER